jgi:hypothetical protein
VPQSSIYGYLAGTPVVVAELLSSITIAYSGTVFKDYILNYVISPTTGRKELHTVTECTDSGASNCSNRDWRVCSEPSHEWPNRSGRCRCG